MFKSVNTILQESNAIKIDELLKDKNPSDIKEILVVYAEKKQQIESRLLSLIIETSNSEEIIPSKISCAKMTIQEMTNNMKNIKKAISNTEEKLNLLCSDIRKLDTAKQNLVCVIQTITSLSSLEEASGELLRLYEETIVLSENDQSSKISEIYCIAAEKFKTTIECLEQSLLLEVRELRRIKSVVDKVEKVKNFFVDIIYEDFGKFKAVECLEDIDNEEEQSLLKKLKSGCKLLDVVSSKSKTEKNSLIDWIVEIHIQKYENSFLEKRKQISFEFITEILSQYKCVLNEYSKKYSLVIPASWGIEHCISEKFILTTKKYFDENIGTLITALPMCEYVQIIQLFLKFESEVTRYFRKPSNDSLSNLFLQHSNNYILFERKNLKNITDQISLSLMSATPIPENKKAKRLTQVDALFLYVKKSFALCRKIKISSIFSSICSEYQFSFNELLCILKNFSQHRTANLQSDVVKCEENVLADLCLIVGTCEYVRKIVFEFSKSIKSSFDFVPVEFDEQLKDYLDLCNHTINKISQLVAAKCRNCLTKIEKQSCEKLKLSGDPNASTRVLEEIFQTNFDFLFENLSFELYTIVCGRFIQSFSDSFKEVLFAARKKSKTGAQQLLVDLYAIKAAMTNSLGKDDLKKNNKLIKRSVSERLSEIEGILKVLSSEQFPLETFCVLFPHGSSELLLRILDIKYDDLAKKKEILSTYNKHV